MKKRMLAGGVVLAVLILAGSVRAQKETYAKPEDAFDAFYKAMKKNDFKAAYHTMTPESGDRLLGGFIALVQVFKQLAKLDTTGKALEKFKPIDDLLAKHGLKGEKFEDAAKAVMEAKDDPKKANEAAIKMVSGVKDRATLLGDLMTQLDKMSGGKAKKGVPESKLSDVKVDKDTATGTVTYKEGDTEKTQKFTFKKIKDSWKVELPDDFGTGKK